MVWSDVFDSLPKLGLPLALLSLLNGGTKQAIAEPICSPDLTAIAPQLVADLPSYGNRAIQQARRLQRVEDTYSYILVANSPELQPLPIGNQQYTAAVPDTTEQIFFTTLERKYLNNTPITYENYYWLFVTPSEKGWAIVYLLTSLTDFNRDGITAPPLDFTQSVIGTATRRWLRDYNAHCAAG